MSRAARVGILLGLWAAFAAAPGVEARQTTEAELEQRLEELLPRLEQAEAERAAARERLSRQLEAARPEMVELRVGPLRMFTPPGQEELAREVVQGVWEREFAPWVDASPGFEGHRFYLDWRYGAARAPEAAPGLHRIQARRWQSRSYVERGVRTSITRVLREDVGHTRVGLLAQGTVREPRRPELLYRALATVPSTSLRACLAGSERACLVSMGLRIDDDPVDDWYDAEERYLLARRSRQLLYATGTTEDIAACDRGSRAGCDALLASYVERHGHGWMTPVRPDVRGTLVWIALEAGGEGAWSRLIADPEADPVAALEAASGLPVETLVSRWRDYAIEHRPRTFADTRTAAAGALFWTLLLSTLATRSTRWRLG